MITVIGLGVQAGDITARGEQAILAAARAGEPILVRTAKTQSYQSVQALGVPHVCLDYVYEKSRSFQTLAENLAKAVKASGDNAVYLVDGAASEDYSVKALYKKLRGKLDVIDGVSKITSIADAAKFKGCSYTAVSAYELSERARAGAVSLPLIVYDMDDRALAGDCKLVLGDLFGEETAAKYVCGGQAKPIRLYETDRQAAYDYSSAVAIEESALLKKTRFKIEDLQELIVRLRQKDGCPWDRVQTSSTIKMSAVEEAYELVDAIDSADEEKILEETGDVLLQAVFHAVIQSETGAFTLTDAVTGVCNKLITRHTHVFGADKAKDDAGALGVWEANKRKEKGQDTFGKSVNDVPKCFPAAMRAQKIGKRAAKAGMDFSNVEAAAARLQEELQEFFAARANGDIAAIEKELGDVLFAAINVGRKADVDCEKALKESAERFAARFTLAEQKALADGKDVTLLTEAEWDAYYLAAKADLQR